MVSCFVNVNQIRKTSNFFGVMEFQVRSVISGRAEGTEAVRL
jgi:hypothetical protein